MVKYKCDNCDKEFKQKNDLDRHKNRKFKCKSVNSDDNMSNNLITALPVQLTALPVQLTALPVEKLHIDDENQVKNLTCIYCLKKFTRTYNLNKHIEDICKVKEVKDKMDLQSKELLKLLQIERAEKEQQQNELKKMIQINQQETTKTITELKNTISELKHTVSQPITNTTNSNNTTNNINNNNTINNNIILQFGADVEPNALTQEEIIQLLNQNLAYIVPKMAELYHFDINKPKYHNVYISDKKSKFAVVFNGKQYISAFLDDTIDMIDNKMKSHLRLFMRKLKMNDDDTQKIPVNDIKRMSKQLEKLNDLEDTDDLQKRSNQYLKFVLFDNKEMVKDTRNKLDRTTKQRKNKINKSSQIAVDY